jgi:hypothetical protein
VAAISTAASGGLYGQAAPAALKHRFEVASIRRRMRLIRRTACDRDRRAAFRPISHSAGRLAVITRSPELPAPRDCRRRCIPDPRHTPGPPTACRSRVRPDAPRPFRRSRCFPHTILLRLKRGEVFRPQGKSFFAFHRLIVRGSQELAGRNVIFAASASTMTDQNPCGNAPFTSSGAPSFLPSVSSVPRQYSPYPLR